MTLKVEWVDYLREPRCAPDPAFPTGKDIDCSGGAPAACKADLPHPAKRCGLYLVECEACGIRIGITTAGRPDDPRSVKIACKKPEQVQ
jgi:hypothetical protein